MPGMGDGRVRDRDQIDLWDWQWGEFCFVRWDGRCRVYRWGLDMF